MKTSLKATPDENSGHNPNTPIRIYDTHPNQRFAIGDQVLKIDFEEPRVLGRVLGHIAEDRILVQWPHTASQEDVDDVISTQEWAYGFLDDPDYRLQGKKRRANRKAVHSTGHEIEQMDAQVTSDDYEKFHRIMEDHLEEGGVDPEAKLSIADAVNELSDEDQQKLLIELKKLDYEDSPTAGKRTALLPRALGGTGVPQWMGGTGTYQQQQQRQPSQYNPLRLPEVESFLERAGLARADVQNFASQYDKALELKTQKQNVRWEQMLRGQEVPAGFQQPLEFGQQVALPWQMKQRAPAPGAVPLPSPTAPAIAPLPAFRDIPQQLAPTSASRRKAGRDLLHTANLLKGLGHRKAAQVIMATTDVVAALENLYKNKKTRNASQDKTARRAMGVAILATLGITEVLRNTKKAGLKRAADDVDLALIQALTYPRTAQAASALTIFEK